MTPTAPAVEAPNPITSGDWRYALFEAIDDAVFVHDHRGNILEANPAACLRLGYTREELLRLNTRDIDDPDFAAGFKDRLAAQVVKGSFRFEGRHRTKDGRIVPVDINTSTVILQGKPAILAVMRDITQQKLTENTLSAQYAVARALAETDSLAASARQILQVLCESLGIDMGVLWLVNPSQNCLTCLETWHAPTLSFPRFEEATRRISLDKDRDVPGQAWSWGVPVSQKFQDPSAEVTLRCGLAQSGGLKVSHAFPIPGSAGTAGVIEFLSRSMENPTDDFLSMMQAIGNQIGQVLERQRFEDALRDSEALYQSLVQSLPQNIFRKDRAGRVTFANKHYCETLHIPLPQLMGKTDFDLFPPELAAKYVEDDRRVLEKGIPFETVEAHHLPEGGTIYVQVVKTPVYDAQGNTIGIQGIFWDVTERKRAEEFLTESERRYRQLTEATLDGIVLIDDAEVVRLFNPAAERMFGHQAAELIGRPACILVPKDARSASGKGFFRYLHHHHSQFIGRTVEINALRADGDAFPVEIAVTLITFKGGLPGGGGECQFLCAFRDLTERNKMRSVLFHNEKMASIGFMSAGVAHEINNPLAFVANNLVVLERDVKGIMALLNKFEAAKDKLAQVDSALVTEIDNLENELDIGYTRENLPRLIERTREGVDRVTRIVHSLRGLARTDSPRHQSISIPDLIENSLEVIRGRYKRSGIVVEQDHDPNPRISCVQTQISQVILNLLVNAYQALEGHYKDGGGVIMISTRRVGKDMLLEVADNGPGIASEIVGKIFDPFFTTKDVGEGTGLGLHFTHTIVAAHGGHVEVLSEPGQGATFRVYLPIQDPKDLK